MVRDILAVPVSGVGVKQLFNMAYNICHYRRSHLKADTISKLMIMKHFDSIILEEEVVSTDVTLDIGRKRYEQEEASRKEDLKSADFIEISDCSDIDIDKNDYNASGYQNDSQIYTRPNTPAEGSTVPNTPISNFTDNMVFTVIPDR